MNNALATRSVVMAALDAAIQETSATPMDGRVKPGHDSEGAHHGGSALACPHG
jgi:hypothetical protein